MISNSSIDLQICQEPLLLSSGSPSELVEIQEKFLDKKISNLKIADFYKSHFPDNFNKFERVRDCGSFLKFAHIFNIETDSFDTHGKLYQANFCRDRLCPYCNWRRSLKLFHNNSVIISDIWDKYLFASLTLTVPNVPGEKLKKTIDDLMSGINKLFHYKAVKNVVRGYYRALEVTYNQRSNTFHPHYHFVLAFDKSYFTSPSYLSHSQWLELWRKAMNDNSILMLDIKRLYNKLSGKLAESEDEIRLAFLEFCKYSVKDSDMINDFVIMILFKSLFHRRLVEYKGVFRDSFVRNKLEDSEDENADLIHADDDIEDSISLLILSYQFNHNSKEYELVDQEIKRLKKAIKTQIKFSGVYYYE